MVTDSRNGYGAVSKTFHWLMALLVGWQLLKFGDRIAEGEHWLGQVLVPRHLSIGVLLLALAIARLIWAFSQRGQRPTHDPAVEFFVRTGHGLLYAGLILLPLTGVLLMAGGGHGLSAFGVQPIAEGGKIAWAQSLGSLHSPLAWMLGALIVGHAAMALLHHFVGRDRTLARIA